MLEVLASLLELAKGLTPTGILIVMVVGVYLLYTIATNHLHDLPEMKQMLVEIRDGIKILVDRTER